MQHLNTDDKNGIHYNLIRKYISDSLNPAEDLLMAELYQEDEDFRDALDGFEGMTIEEFDEHIAAIDQNITLKIKKEVTVLSTDKVKQLKPVPTNNYKSLAIAASVLLIFGLASAIFFSSLSGKTEKIYANHFELKSYPDMIKRGEGDDLSTTEKMAISAYNAENFEISTTHFEKLSADYPNNIKYGLFLGIAYLADDEPNKAISVLERINHLSSNYCNDINWYLGLAYLKVKNKGAAKEVFEKLAIQDCYYKVAAQKILDKL